MDKPSSGHLRFEEIKPFIFVRGVELAYEPGLHAWPDLQRELHGIIVENVLQLRAITIRAYVTARDYWHNPDAKRAVSLTETVYDLCRHVTPATLVGLEEVLGEHWHCVSPFLH